MLIDLIKPYSSFPIKIPHLGLGWLATSLRKNGHDVNIIDCQREGLSHEKLMKILKEDSPSFIGISIFSADLIVAKKIVSDIKKILPDCKVVAGGPHPTCLPEHTVKFIPQLDFAFIGEGEIGFPMLVSGDFKYEEIPGLVWREESRIKKNPPHFEMNLDSLGLPSWDLLKLELQSPAPHGAFLKNMPSAPIIITRGCPFPCTFCAARKLSGKRLRRRSLESVFEEIDYLVKKKGIREIHIEDDNFTLKKDYAMKFCEELLRRDYKISWSCPNGIRLDTLDTELISLMKRSGCYSVSAGIESGSERILKAIKKKLTVEEIERGARLIHEADIKITGFFIVGFPEEKKEDIEETIKFAKKLPLDRAQFSTFLPLPGTIYFDEYLKEVPLDKIPWNHFFTTDVVYSPDGISKEELSKLKKKAFLLFYFRPKILYGILKEIKSLKHLLYIFQRVFEIFK